MRKQQLTRPWGDTVQHLVVRTPELLAVIHDRSAWRSIRHSDRIWGNRGVCDDGRPIVSVNVESKSGGFVAGLGGPCPELFALVRFEDDGPQQLGLFGDDRPA